MNKKSSIILSVALAVIISLFLNNYFLKKDINQSTETSVFNRVIDSNTLRCGYGLWEYGLEKDPNTGEMSGFVVEMMEELTQSMGIKLEWVEEINWGQVPVALETRKIDAMCAGLWASAHLAPKIGFTDPLFYNSVHAFVRADDTRFGDDPIANFQRINQNDIKTSVNDKDITEEITDRYFPQTQKVYKGQLGGNDILMMNVINKKADIFFLNEGEVVGFSKNNPGQLKKVKLAKPLRVYPATIAVDIDEYQLLEMLNTGIHQLHNNGIIADMHKKYEQESPDLFTLPQSKYSQ